MRAKKIYSAEFKTKIAIEAVRGELTMNEIASKYGVHTTQINRWKQQAVLGVKNSFTGKLEKAVQSEQQRIEDLYRQIGKLSCENEFLKKSVWK